MTKQNNTNKNANTNANANTAAQTSGVDALRETAQNRFESFAPMQSRRDSWREAWQNTALAFVLSILAHRYCVMPLLDEWAALGNNRADWTAATLTTLFYTILSLGRNYAIRRYHARKDHARQKANH